jgi:protocatechuate 3,4-dioxygenase beta subunit
MKVQVGLVAFFTLIGTARPQASGPANVPQGYAIKGRIVQQVRATPIRKANVQLNNIGPWGGSDEIQYETVTDAEGHFQFSDVRAGDYRISYDRTGFVDAERYRQGNGKLVSVGPGSTLEDLLFHMASAAVITGRVLDADGDPIPNVGVGTLRYPISWHATSDPHYAVTNDLGEFRISGLPAGKFLVAAEPMQKHPRVAENAKKLGHELIYTVTYYPDTPEVAQATPLTLHPGDEVKVDLTLAQVHPASVKGQVSNLPAGESDISIALRPLGDTTADVKALPVDQNGHFEVHDLLPGFYSALIIMSSSSGTTFMRGNQTVQVSNADIPDLQIAALPNGHIRGRIRIENVSKVDFPSLQVTLSSSQRPGRGSFSGQASEAMYWDEINRRIQVGSDASFEFKDIPAGDYRVLVTATGEALADYYVKSVNLEGKEVIGSGFATSASVQTLEIVLSAKGATVEGLVAKDNEPAAFVKVITIPDADRRDQRELFQVVATDRQGHFQIRGLSPGEYRVIALDEDFDEEITDPEFAQKYESLGQTIKVEEGERSTITLKLRPADN